MERTIVHHRDRSASATPIPDKRRGAALSAVAKPGLPRQLVGHVANLTAYPKKGMKNRDGVPSGKWMTEMNTAAALN
jgi:hypothetical protein